MKIIKLIRRFVNFMKFGGETYLEINQIHSEKLLDGKNVVITGGTSGIGYEIAKKCLDLGAKVLITGRERRRNHDRIRKILWGRISLKKSKV